MKRLFFTAIPALLILIVALGGCKEQNRITMEQTNLFQDSIVKIIPGIRSVHTMQKDDPTQVTIIVGSPSFYDADAGAKQQAAINTGLIILHFVGADNSLKNATFVISKKDMNENKVPDDGISIDMKIDSLNKVVYPK